MSLSSTSNSLKSSGTFNSNSSINSAPSADRYAALKDLDEQLRELKEKENFNNAQPSATPAMPTANPFKVSMQQSTHPLSAQAGNPFQSQATPATQNSWLTDPQTFNGNNGSMYAFPNGVAGNQFAMNTFNGQSMKQPVFNGTNGLHNGFAQKNPFAVS